MSKQTINFTKTNLKGLPIPEGRRVTYHDEKTPYLILIVTKTGGKTFYYYRKIRGYPSPERIHIGKFPQVTCEMARKEAAVIGGLIADGVNLNQIRREDRQELTLQTLFMEYMERYAKLRKKSWDQDQYRFDTYLKKLHSRKLSAISRSEVDKLHSRLGKDIGAHTANRALALLKKLLNVAIQWGYLEGANPCIGIPQFRETSRDRFLQSDEVAQFFEALSEETNETFRDYVLISLLTGARKNNVLAMRWSDINLDRAEWRIPDTKGGEPLLVPLSPEAVNVLQDRLYLCNGSKWVFPSHSKAGYFTSPYKAWNKLLERAGLENFRIHDLRRTMGSWQAKNGASLTLIGKSLGHKSVSTTAIYARLDIDPVRESMEAATKAIMSAAKPEKNNVIKLKRKGNG